MNLPGAANINNGMIQSPQCQHNEPVGPTHNNHKQRQGKPRPRRIVKETVQAVLIVDQPDETGDPSKQFQGAAFGFSLYSFEKLLSWNKSILTTELLVLMKSH